MARSISVVQAALSRPPSKLYVMGWVVGLIYHDDYEWLFRGKSLTRQQGVGPETEPTCYKDREKALEVARTVQVTHGTMGKSYFVREYIYSTWRDVDLPLLGKRDIERIELPPLTATGVLAT